VRPSLLGRRGFEIAQGRLGQVSTIRKFDRLAERALELLCSAPTSVAFGGASEQG
jgi:hypothetical protein